VVIGIDPGLDGAVVCLGETAEVVSIEDTPWISVKRAKGKKRVYLDMQMANMLRKRMEFTDVRMVAVESVHAMPGQGVTSMFSMGFGLGLWIGILSALQLPYQLVEPKKWKSVMRIPTGADKKASILQAQRLFPSAALIPDGCRVPHDGRAEALLIAEYARRHL